MKIGQISFNTYLLWALGAVLAAGCASPDRKKSSPTVRVYLEVNPAESGKYQTVPIGEKPLFEVTVSKDPFLTEHHIKEARVRDDGLGGFEMSIEYNRPGRWLLEEYSTACRGKRAAVLVTMDDLTRYVAAPVMNKHIGDGVLTFTPDLTRQEAEDLARRLNEEEKRQKMPDY